MTQSDEMTPEARKEYIRISLEVFRDDIEKMRDECAEEITPQLKALGIDVSNDSKVYDAIEAFAKIDAETFFSAVGFDMSNICEDIAFREG